MNDNLQLTRQPSAPDGYYRSSDTYQNAMALLRPFLRALPRNCDALRIAEQAAEKIALSLKDSSETLADDRMICRHAAADLMREFLEDNIRALDLIVQGINCRLDTLLQWAQTNQDLSMLKCLLIKDLKAALEQTDASVQKAKQSLDNKAFTDTLHHLQTARSCLFNVSSISPFDMATDTVCRMFDVVEIALSILYESVAVSIS